MADSSIDQTLRDMAAHRGLRLLKSRRRKPGIGDYGKFGLTDAGGKALLGVGKDGLTASPDDIKAYLRQGAASTWEASVKAAPTRPPHSPKARQGDEAQAAERAQGPRSRRVAADPVRSPKVERTDEEWTAAKAPASDARGKSAERKRRNKMAEKTAKPAPTIVEPSAKPASVALKIRNARPSDAARLLALLRQRTGSTTDELAIARNLEKVRKSSGGTCVAEQGDIVGCCSWTIVQTLQHGLIGRISLLLVDKGHRRQGIGTAMLDHASAALQKAGCGRIEAMSDIEINNAHNFFRTHKFAQTSYRFARDMPATD